MRPLGTMETPGPGPLTATWEKGGLAWRQEVTKFAPTAGDGGAGGLSLI